LDFINSSVFTYLKQSKIFFGINYATNFFSTFKQGKCYECDLTTILHQDLLHEGAIKLDGDWIEAKHGLICFVLKKRNLVILENLTLKCDFDSMVVVEAMGVRESIQAVRILSQNALLVLGKHGFLGLFVKRVTTKMTQSNEEYLKSGIIDGKKVIFRSDIDDVAWDLVSKIDLKMSKHMTTSFIEVSLDHKNVVVCGYSPEKQSEFLMLCQYKYERKISMVHFVKISKFSFKSLRCERADMWRTECEDEDSWLGYH
jgi:hypothetical protein